MTPNWNPETSVFSLGRKAGAQSDELGAAGAPGPASQQVLGEAGMRPDNAPSRQPGQPAGARRTLNADQITLLLIGLLLAVAIVVAAVILSKNL
jgi:hypothetical protein